MRGTSQGLLVAVLLLSFAPPSRGEQQPLLPLEAHYLLTAIDSIPTRAQLEAALPGDTVAQLVQLAFPTSGNPEFGVQLRALRALSLFAPPTPSVRDNVKKLISHPGDLDVGKQMLLTVAALETLAQFRFAADLQPVADQLSHPSRDVRVAAARAMRRIGTVPFADAKLAITLLQSRQIDETVPAVRLAISEAIQALAQGP
jgi:HEAT repeat protein